MESNTNTLPLFYQLNLTGPPGFIEKGLQRTVETQDGEPAFLRIRLDPVPFGYTFGLFGAEVDGRRVICVCLSCRRRVTLAAGPREHLWRLQHRAGLIVVNGERPKPSRGDVLWQNDFVGFGAIERLTVRVYIAH